MSFFLSRRTCPMFYFFVFSPVLFFSCIGASSQIKLNGDGSGSIIQEYRVSLELENMGKLDGNEGQPPVPAGKADLERTVARVPGLRLVSYNSREEGRDMVYKAELAFETPEALEALFAGDGQQFKVDVKGKRITICFPAAGTDDLLFKDMMVDAFKGYEFSLSFLVPGAAKAAWFDTNGKAVGQFPGTCSVGDKTVSYSVPMADLAYLDNSLNLEISW